jgi:hypothetical protein
MSFFINHAKVRAAERYGVALSDRDLAIMCRMIREGKCVDEGPSADGTRKVIVIYENRAFFAIYKPSANRILTFMPKGWNDHATRDLSDKEARRNIHKARRRSA